MHKEVVITGFNYVSSLGNNPNSIIEKINSSEIGFNIADFDQEIATLPIKNFKLREIIGRFKNSKYLNRGAQLALAAAYLVKKNSNLSEDDLEKAGLFIGSGPNFDITSDFPEIKNSQLDNKYLKALWMLKYLPNTASSAISQTLGIHGENSTIGTACSASLQAIGEAYRKIKDGYLKVAFAGGGDSRLNRGGILAYKKAQALMKKTNQPNKNYAPFSLKRSGFIPGEGGAFFILEEKLHALKRNARIYAEIKGYGNSLDGSQMTAPLENGKYAKQAIKNALIEANNPQIDLVCAHGTGTKLNDITESNIIEEFFPHAKITALKSWIGHLSAACGATELALFLALQEKNIIPPIRNLDITCNKKLNFIKTTQLEEINNFIIENFGFGGQNTALIIRKYHEN